MSEETQNRSIKAQPYGDYGPNPRLHPVYAALVFVVAVIVMTVAQGLAGAFGVMVLHVDLSDLKNQKSLLFMLYVMFGFSSLLFILWVRFVENRPVASMGLSLARIIPRFVRGYALGLGFLASVVLIIFALGGYDLAAIAPAFSTPAALGTIGLFLIGFIIQGSSEEIMMRGWVMSAMAARFGLVIAIIVNASVFGALHLGNEGLDHINWIAMANIVLVGIFLSLYAVREGSLIGVCAWHGAWNWLLGLGFGLDVSGMTIDTPALIADFDNKADAATWLTGGSFGPEGSLVVTGILLAGCLWFLLVKNKPAS